MTSEIRTNSITSRAGLSTVTLTDSGPMFSGITTFVNNSTFSVGTGGTIHAPSTNTLNIGVNNTESIRIDSNSNLKVAGIVTATHFHGDGSNLTGISAGTSLSGSTNDTVCTVTGANAITGESNLTFNGQKLNIVASDGGTDVKFAVRNTNANGFGAYISGGGNNNQYILRLDDKDQNEYFRVSGIGHVGILNGNPQRRLHIGNSGNAESNIRLQGGADYFEMRVKDSDNAFSIHRNIASGGSSEALRIRSSSEISFGGSGYAGQPLTLHSTNPNLGYMITTDTNRGVMSFRDANSTQNVGFGCIGNNHVFMKDGTEKARITDGGDLTFLNTQNVTINSSYTNGNMTIGANTGQQSFTSIKGGDNVRMENYESTYGTAGWIERFRIYRHGYYTSPVRYGDSVETKSMGRQYVISGATPFDGTYNSNTDTPIMRCGHSFNGTMYIAMVYNGDNHHRGTRQMVIDCQGTYGYVVLHIKSSHNQNALGAGLNSLSFNYQNSGSPNYYFKVAGTWASGQSDIPWLLWSWVGHNSEYPYAL